MGHLTALKDLRQKGFVIPGSDGTVNLGAYSEAAEKLWRKARAEAKAAKTKEAPGSPPESTPLAPTAQVSEQLRSAGKFTEGISAERRPRPRR